jgi:hypothetical protein
MTRETTEDNVKRQFRFDTKVRAAVLILLTTAFFVNKVDIIALPNGNSSNFNFSYKFEPTAASCPGDYGRGVLTVNSSPWDY